jgi:branched-chain amino acid transport system ATP-binding protein
MTGVFIEARGVQAWYATSHVLHGVDFTLARGEAVGLLGHNGMGKTTLIRAMLGLVRDRIGEIRVDGRDVMHARADEVARLGVAYVPEGRGIFPNLTVRENLLVASRAAREGEGWTLERVLASFPRLAQRLGHWGSQLSGGEQQMLAIGRALMTQPRAIVLDEATEGLAPRVVEEVWRVIAEIRAAGIAALIVDRDYRKVARRSDRVVVLQKGRVALEGASARLLDNGALASLLGL